MNNSTQGNITSHSTHPNPIHILITLYSILLAWSLLGNVLVIAVVYCNQNLRTNINYLIVNMAVSDLLVPLVAMPWSIWNFATKSEWLVDGPLGEALCKLFPFLFHISPLVSSISLVIIAFQRFIAVVYRNRRQNLSRKTRWIAIAFPWIVAMAIFSPFFCAYRLINVWGYTKCDYSWSPAFDNWRAEMILICIQTAVGFVIPFIIIIILYTIIVYELHKSLYNVMNLMQKETIRSRQRRNRRIFSMLITIVVMFTICWCPLKVCEMLYYSNHHSLLSMDHDTFGKMYNSFLYMWLLLAAINPSIYFVFLRDFRQGLKSLCCRKTTAENELIPRRPRTPGGDSNQDPTCTRCTRTSGGDSNQDPTCNHLTSIPLQSRMNINTIYTRT
ncbi:neuropeptide Y receptor type 6-like [Actinia tenebrosa]|uniref:Neuropeptide Y receptor type 6-like n=1 Tax=Actinia tenebrosa TaxID=6105 RepID=A0A6P8HTN9_ACTTE|nr:neuropeptide Y receptor type 6-like [Actinia tenebrosa]